GLYAMRVEGAHVVFFADSAPIYDAWHSEPGVIYREAPPEILETAADGKQRFTGPYTDEYATYYSAFAPVYASPAELVAVMGADIEKSNFDSALNRKRMPMAGLTIL